MLAHNHPESEPRLPTGTDSQALESVTCLPLATIARAPPGC